MIKEIERIFTTSKLSSLPGMTAHIEMAPPYRHQLFMKNAQYKDAAVAMLLYKKGNDLCFPLIRRTSGNPNDKHSGQISLPGGKLDAGDAGFADCAVRELKEELGIEKLNISLMGELSELLIPVSNYRVRPFIFSTVENPVFYPQESEVQYVLEVKLEELLAPGKIETGEVELDSGIRLPDIPYFNLNDHKIWGATAMILNEFKNVCSNIKTNYFEQR